MLNSTVLLLTLLPLPNQKIQNSAKFWNQAVRLTPWCKWSRLDRAEERKGFELQSTCVAGLTLQYDCSSWCLLSHLFQLNLEIKQNSILTHFIKRIIFNLNNHEPFKIIVRQYDWQLKKIKYLTVISGFLTNKGVGNKTISVIPIKAACQRFALTRLSKTLANFDAILVGDTVVARLSVIQSMHRPTGKPLWYWK